MSDQEDVDDCEGGPARTVDRETWLGRVTSPEPLLSEIYSAPPNTKTPSVRLCPGFIANPNELMPETGTDQKFWNRKHLHPSSHQAHTCPPSIKKKIFSQTFAERNHPWKKRFVTRIGFAICMGKWQLLGSRADLATSSIQGRAGWRRYR